MNTLETIKRSKSHHQYKDEVLTEEQMKILINCGLCAPSSKDEEPWYLVGILNKEKVAALDADLKELHGDNKEHFYQAPCAILVTVNKKATTPVVDAATCTQNILLAAEDLNLASCWIDGVLSINKSDKFKTYQQAYKIPEGYEFQAAIALGNRIEEPTPKTVSTGKSLIIK